MTRRQHDDIAPRPVCNIALLLHASGFEHVAERKPTLRTNRIFNE
jgi:hypothetical protein